MSGWIDRKVDTRSLILSNGNMNTGLHMSAYVCVTKNQGSDLAIFSVKHNGIIL